MSGIGKGHVTSSIGKMLQFRGFKVLPVKIDPYLNTDPGLMNPAEHGEVFVTDEVWNFTTINKDILHIAELDQDFGSYERFLDQNMHPSQNISSGQIFTSILSKERKGDYLGKTVQMIPHVTNEIKRRILIFSNNIDNDNDNETIILVEIGGTVGDIEGDIFLEAVRQLQQEMGRENVIFVHTTLVPYNKPIQEFKTKPTQHSTQQLLSRGIFPDFIVCRSDFSLDQTIKSKIAMFCNVKSKYVIDNQNMPQEQLYSLPLHFEEQLFGDLLLERLNLRSKLSPIQISENITSWKNMIEKFENSSSLVTVGIAGKYTINKDAYKSIKEALLHAAGSQSLSIKIEWIDTEKIMEISEAIKDLDGILVPGGFGKRGTEKKIEIAGYALSKNIPYLGICFGMQMATVAFARYRANLKDANSLEIENKTTHPIITLQEDQKRRAGLGGTMRLGAWKAKLKSNTYISKIYGSKDEVSERHRHRWEVNSEFIPTLEEKGLVFSGFSSDTNLVEFIELPEDEHIFFIGTQAHPEFKSRPMKPHPLYVEFIKKCYQFQTKKAN
jgi:CTP synthase